VLITGASSGIGRVTALAMAKEGAHVALAARRVNRLEALTREIEARGGKAAVFACDVTSAEAVREAVNGCVKQFGRLDVLVNNAGAGLFASMDQTTEEDLDCMLAVNLKGTFYGIKAVLPIMRRQGTGHIINVASTAGRRGSPYIGAYCASKFALVGLTESLRVELLGTGIDVSLVCPGATLTEFFDVAKRRTAHHRGLVGPVETAEQVAKRIVSVAQRPRAEVLAQPFRRKVFFVLNLLTPGFIDRFLRKIVGGHQHGHQNGAGS
jgi:uncharacterized protein